MLRSLAKKVKKRVQRKLGMKHKMEKIDHARLVAEFISNEQITPAPCNNKIFKEGELLCILAGPRTWTIERWVQKVAELADAKVDWHFAGGRACVYYLGGAAAFKRIVEAVEATKPAFEEAAQMLAKLHEEDKENTEWAYEVQWMTTQWGQVPS